MSTKDLIAEMTENVNKYGGENMTTYLMVQAIKELGRLSSENEALRAQVEALKVVASQAPWIQFPDTYADPFTYVIQHLNSNPYNLTKDECVTVIKTLRSDFGIRGTPKVREDDILLQEAVWRIKDMLGEDDGHAFKEARKWLERYEKNRAIAQSPLTRPAVPEGWKLVPVEPTAYMQHAALNDSRKNAACGMTRMLTDGCELWAAREVYRVMLAAAPQPEATIKESSRVEVQATAEEIEREIEQTCMVPPLGWRCTRTSGHEGPCAAVPCPEDVELVQRGMERLREAQPTEHPCYCGNEISLQSVSGGAAPEGLYGRVTLLVDGKYQDYVKSGDARDPVEVQPTEAAQPRIPFAGYDPKFCPGSNPDNPQPWPDDETAQPIDLKVIREWPKGFDARLQHVWLDVISFIPNVKLWDLQRTLAEFGFTMKVTEKKGGA